MSAPTQVLGTIHELAAEAQTTPQMMRALWRLAADATKNMQKGVSNILCAKVQHLVECKILPVLIHQSTHEQTIIIPASSTTHTRIQPPSSFQAWNANYPTQSFSTN
jgi:hypothetical protein